MSDNDVRELVQKSIQAGSLVYGVKEAQEWSEGFSFPPEVRQTDWEDLGSLDYNLVELVRQRQNVRKPSRFNAARVEGWSDEDPNKPFLWKLIDGITIFTSPDFAPNGKPPAMRERYLEVAPAVNKIMYELYKSGAVLLLPTDKLSGIPHSDRIHYSCTSWAPKKNKKQGRPITDPSFIPKPMKPLNDEWSKEKIKAEYGEIIHPTLHDIVSMILEMTDQYGWDKIILWKHNLTDAFMLLDIVPESAQLLANKLTENMTLIYMVGMFGWVGTPYAFDIITRSLRWAIRRKITGRTDMYVDDIMGCSTEENREEDMSIAAEIARRLLGPNAIAETKAEFGRRIEMLGWVIDLDKRVVFIAEHNFMKTFHGFFSLDLEKPIPYRTIEKLASWASRYSLLSRCMKPFVNVF
jgi:hypothetical protein